MNSKAGFIDEKLIAAGLWAVALFIAVHALGSGGMLSKPVVITLIVIAVSVVVLPADIVLATGFVAFHVALIFLVVVSIKGCVRKDTAVDINEPQSMTNANPPVEGIGTNRAEPSP